jgi:type I restriction enzyme, S subunit
MEDTLFGRSVLVRLSCLWCERADWPLFRIYASGADANDYLSGRHVRHLSVPFSYIGGNAMALDRLDLQRVDRNYLYHCLQHRGFRDAITGAAQPQITRQNLARVEIPLPPRNEQRRIAAILDKTDALRGKRKRALELLDSLTQSIFLEMFGDPLSNPNSYPLFHLSDIAETRLGKMLDASKQSLLPKFNYLANTNVQWGCFDLSNLRTMSFSNEDRIEFSLRAGDLLICEGGEIGRCAIWREESNDCYFQKALHRLRCNTKLVLPEIMELYFKLMAENGGLSKLTTVATIPHLTGVKLRTLLVPVPPMNDQMKFVAAYKQVAEQKGALDKHSRNINEMFLSLQHRAFSGQL